MPYIDSLLNRLTMYRLVLYVLTALAAVAVVLGFLGVLPYSGVSLLLSFFILTATAYASNVLFAAVFRAPYNPESSFITAFILFFILAPVNNASDALILVGGAAAAMASKYVLAWRKQHIFNPAAFGAFVLGLSGIGAAIWWVATPILLVPALIAGMLIVRKIRRFTLVLTFAGAALVTHFAFGNYDLVSFFTSWPLIFFGTVMLTEPRTGALTTPVRIAYGILIGTLFSWQGHVGPVYFSPEFALLVGNLFVFVANPRQRAMLRLRSRTQLTSTIYEYEFESDKPMKFVAGQYAEWSLPHPHFDLRGIRRYFTIASSPTDTSIRVATRTPSTDASSFKQALAQVRNNDTVTLSHVSGSFTLPRNKNHKLLWIAGGIGITPFISMMRYMQAQKEKRDIVLLYTCSSPEDIAYHTFIDEIAPSIGAQTHLIADGSRITTEIIQTNVSDYRERIVYISGPDRMVRAVKRNARELDVAPWNIKTDYFPGL